MLAKHNIFNKLYFLCCECLKWSSCCNTCIKEGMNAVLQYRHVSWGNTSLILNKLCCVKDMERERFKDWSSDFWVSEEHGHSSVTVTLLLLGSTAVWPDKKQDICLSGGWNHLWSVKITLPRFSFIIPVQTIFSVYVWSVFQVPDFLAALPHKLTHCTFTSC